MLCREFYEHLRDWIVETELDRYRSGRVFEYMWAVMFGAPAVSEPLEECDLLTCTAEVSTYPSASNAGKQRFSSLNAKRTAAASHVLKALQVDCMAHQQHRGHDL